MKIAIISDVHANLIALKSVMERIDEENVGKILCAGDVVGYYPYPNETIEFFRSNKVTSIAGNHDRSTLYVDTMWMNSMAAQAIVWTHRHLDELSIDFLRSLPGSLKIEESGTSLALYHGSPLDDDEYVYEDEALPHMIEECGCSILILGHTHVPFVKRFETGIIINPGSVGQPRDGNPRASFATLDLESKEARINRVEYDIEEVVRRTIDVGLPGLLARRLRFGY